MKRFPRTGWMLLVPLSAFGTASCDRDKKEARTTSPAAKQETNTPAATNNATPMGDRELADAVTRSLERDPGVKLEGIEVKVTDGIVELTGKARDLLTSRRAVRIAELVRGVRAVSDRVEIAVEPRPDRRLETDIEAALLHNAAADSFEIDAKAKDGAVTLTGKVQPYFYPSAPYIETWRHVPLKATRSDGDIAKDIRDELMWSPFVDADEVTVQVNAGEATLTGQVDSYGELSSATENAFEGGAIAVENKLRVAPP
jgi:osmotically-inducible protein OsmY